ncbi:uncharacterized protein LOC107221231 [Neodiprion lecontei]|uniref:Uncharacterized protein LOC107221231 n=1 Tax=Neodiprion lecontei TaxID=441921 RepID=A0A6J0BN04_NEOLC|nr:uncharacterized protein LOC107221231 [Neodiprion lecontei]
MPDKSVRSNVRSRIKNFASEAPFFCKVIELILCVIAVGLIVDPFNNLQMKPDVNHAGLIHVSMCGYILINAIIILCYLLGERQPKRMSIIFAVVGAILCCASGVVLIYDWSKLQQDMIYKYWDQYSNQVVASGVFALLASVVFLIEAFVTRKSE